MKLIDKVGVYIHFPYCPTICNYCNFNKYKLSEHSDFEGFTKAILTELRTELQAYDSRPTIYSIYFGGGTPSLLNPKFVKQIIDELEPTPNTEITIEANPNPKIITFDKLLELKSVGINRVSLGVQSLNEKALQFFNRDHTVSDARKSIKTIQSVFENLSLDFIWGRPFQTLKDWREELEEIKLFGAKHLSLYQLTVERGTRLFKDLKSGAITGMPSEDEMSDLFEETRSRVSPVYTQYEVSSFSTSANHESKHNNGYWSGNDYIGVGPGSHGKVLGNQRTIRIPSPSQWQFQVAQLGHGVKKRTTLSNQDIQRELVVTGLRRIRGISSEEFKNVTAKSLESALDMDAVRSLSNLGFLDVSLHENQLHAIKTTYKGLAVADKLIMQIIK